MNLKLFCDGSVNNQSGVGYGAYLYVDGELNNLEDLTHKVKLHRFENTSSTRLELQILLHALHALPFPTTAALNIYTDSQNITGLIARRERLEENNFYSSKNTLLANSDLYKEFYSRIDNLNCHIIKVKGHKPQREKDSIDKVFSLVDRAARIATQTLKRSVNYF